MGCMSKTELRANKSNLKVFPGDNNKKAMQKWETDFHKHILIPRVHIYAHPRNRPFKKYFFFACMFYCCFLFSKFSNFGSLISKPTSVGRRCFPWQSGATATAHKRIKASQWALNYSLYENALAHRLKRRLILSTCSELMFVEMRSLKTTVLPLDCWQENVLWGIHFKGLSESSQGLRPSRACVLLVGCMCSHAVGTRDICLWWTFLIGNDGYPWGGSGIKAAEKQSLPLFFTPLFFSFSRCLFSIHHNTSRISNISAFNLTTDDENLHKHTLASWF